MAFILSTGHATTTAARTAVQGAHGSPHGRRHSNGILWAGQWALAAVFVFAGGMKLVMPVGDMADESGLPGTFLRFIGIVEVLGGVGVVLPAVLRMRTGLVPLAAAGLVAVMVGAVTVTVVSGEVAGAALPLAVGLVAALVAHGRMWRLPLAAR